MSGMPPILSQILTTFLSSAQRPEGTLTFYEAQGFLFAIACSPVLVKPSEWLPMIFAGQDANYADMDEAQTVLEHLMSLYNLINTQVYMAKVGLPEDFPLEEPAVSNIGESAALGQWSRGYSLGYGWLEEAWEQYTPDALDEELGGCMMVLSFFSNRKMAEAFHKEMTKVNDTPFDEFAENMLDMFQDAMASYANLGRSIYTVLAEHAQDRTPYVRAAKVGRNDPCPCGSGKKYKHCCLH